MNSGSMDVFIISGCFGCEVVGLEDLWKMDLEEKWWDIGYNHLASQISIEKWNLGFWLHLKLQE